MHVYTSMSRGLFTCVPRRSRRRSGSRNRLSKGVCPGGLDPDTGLGYFFPTARVRSADADRHDRVGSPCDRHRRSRCVGARMSRDVRGRSALGVLRRLALSERSPVRTGNAHSDIPSDKRAGRTGRCVTALPGGNLLPCCVVVIERTGCRARLGARCAAHRHPCRRPDRAHQLMTCGPRSAGDRARSGRRPPPPGAARTRRSDCAVSGSTLRDARDVRERRPAATPRH